jgi:bacterioferritin
MTYVGNPEEGAVSKKTIDLLNRAAADELAAVHQYMYFHFHCDDQGYDLLAALFKKTAIDEMIHVEKAAERILFLGGDVDMGITDETQKIHDVKKMLERAAAMEHESAHDYNTWANEAGANADSATKRLFEDLVADEERHYDQYQTEIDNMSKFGERYLALQSIERSKSVSGPAE